MGLYTVHTPVYDGERADPLAGVVYVREGFDWAAFLFAPIWSIARRSWLGLAAWCAAVASIAGVGGFFSVEPVAVLTGLFGLHLLFGFEAGQLRRRSLRRRGYGCVDVVSADRRSDAEIAYGLRLVQASEQNRTPQPAAAARPRPLAPSDAYGLAPLGGGS